MVALRRSLPADFPRPARRRILALWHGFPCWWDWLPNRPGPCPLGSIMVTRAPADWPSCAAMSAERVSAIGFNAVTEKLSLLSEVALDFAAQGSLPRAADHNVEDYGGCKDDDQEGRHQFEENPIRHFLPILEILTWGPRSGSPPRARFSGNADSPDRVQFFRGCGGRRHPPSAGVT